MEDPLEMEVVAIENLPPPSATFGWGAAAIRNGDHLVNSITGLRSSLSNLQYFVEQGSLHLLPRPIKVLPYHLESKLVAVSYKTDSQYSELFESTDFQGEKETLGLFTVCLLLHSEVSKYTRVVGSKLGEEVIRRLGESPTDLNACQAIVRMGLEVAPHHPTLNALRVVLSNNSSQWLERIALACLRNEEDQKRFHRDLARFKTLCGVLHE
jgi:hypothetical protein